VLRWANLADRMRIKGVREPYAELLKDAGVDTVKELKYRNPGRLAEAMARRTRSASACGCCPRKRASSLDRGRQKARSEDQVLNA
jgi:hypothetical protein